jgi:RNA 2',3'-cyclic 3'-phosphodiesterase
VLEHLRPQAPLQWSPTDNFHITTKFIGPWPEERLEELKSMLGSVPKPGPIATAIGGFGWFPNPHQPRFLFAGVRATEALYQLAEDLNSGCQTLGLAPEERKFTPHLTLARVKGAPPLAGLRQAIAQLPSSEFGVTTASKVLLYKSEPGENCSVYTVIGEFPL